MHHNFNVNINEQLLLSSSKYIKQKEYWVTRLAGPPAKTGNLFDMETSALRDEPIRLAIAEIDFSPELSTRILHLGNQADITIYIILLAGLKSLIYRYTGNEDVTVLSPVYQRKNTSALINDFILIRDRIGSRLTFKELLIQLKGSVLEAYENQDYPFNKILVSVLGETGTMETTGTQIHGELSHDEITTIQCWLQNIHGQREIQPVRGMLAFSFNREGDRIKGVIHYDTGCCNDFYMEQLCRHFTGLLEDALGNVNARISDISYLSGQETRRLLFEFNDNQANFSRDKSVYALIEALDDQHPHRMALAHEREQVTYRQLNRAANRMARQLQSAGVGNDLTVAIMLDRSPLIVAAILAVWKAGGAYIPIDPDSPAARIADILRDSNAAVLVLDQSHADTYGQQDTNTTIITVDRHLLEQQHPDVANPGTDMDMNSLAYVIYTSGSTGKPKGAMVEHIGMMNHLQAKINDLQLSGDSVIVQNASIAFDISVWQFFAALCVGGKTVIYPDEIILEPGRFLNRLLENAVTILEVVPSYLTVLLDAMDMPPLNGSPGSPGSSRLPLADTLVYLLVTGEELKPHLVKQWFALYPEIKMVNAYGPTEASDDITHFIMDKPVGEPLAGECLRIPIGKSLQNLFIYIVDENMKLCPVGIKGEICVAGVGVGRGYVGAVEKTQQAFMRDPFDEKQERRLYKTGDLGRWYPDGNIEFLGRKDYQVKIRGFRIELGEIESKLLNVPGIKNAVVEDKEDKNGNKYLCAYIVLSGPEKITIPDLKEKLAVSLPEYMVPAHFVDMKELPLTANGKIDRKALPDPDLSSQPEMMYISEQMMKELVEKEKQSRLLPVDSRLKDLDDADLLFDNETGILDQYSKQTGKTCYPLNHSQRMMYYIEKTYPATSCENEGYIVKYTRQLDRQLLEKAINLAISRNEHLRTRILEIEHRDYVGPAQYICPHSEYSLDRFDLSDKDGTGDKGGREYLEKWVLEKNDIPFHLHDHDLFYFAYLTFSSSESGYYFKFNHIISDGASVALLFKEIDEIYNDLEAGNVPQDRLNPSHIDFMQDEREYLASARAKNDREFWLKYLLPLPEEFIISSKQGNPDIIAGNTRKLVLPDSLRTKMHEYARTQGISLYKLVLSALAIYISRITRLDEFIISTITHGRDKEAYRTMSGMFINFIPLKMKVPGSMDFKSFAEKLGKEVNYILKNHSKYPSGRISSAATKATGEDTRYFWNITLIGHPDEEKGNFEMEHFSSGYEATPLVIHINCSNKDIEGILELEWIYQLEQFSINDIMNMHRGLVTILTAALDNPGKQIDEIECFTREDKENISSATGIGAEMPGSLPLLMEIKGNKLDARNIENALLGYQHITDAAVVARKETSGDKYLCAFVVSDTTLSQADLREYLDGKLPPFMIPAYFVRLENIPLTSSGEIERSLLKTIYLDMGRESRVPMDETEEKLAEIWQEVLAIEKNNITRESNFFSLGGHSLKAVMLAAKIHKGFQVKLALVRLFDNPTLRDMAGIIKQLTEVTEVKFVSIPNREKKEYYALSSAQKRLFILQRFEPALTHYNIPMMVLLKGKPEMTRIESTFKKLISRHESLRTSFELINGDPGQKIHEQVDFRVEYYLFDDDETPKKIEGKKEDRVNEITRNFIRPFTLSQVPLLRVGLVKQDENSHILMVDLHHIISDGVAHNILVRDFTALYGGEELPLLRLSYSDYSEWQQQAAEETRQQEAYWLKQFAGEIPVLNLPLDYPRPVEQSFAGGALAFELGRQESGALNRLARSCGATLFMTLLAVYYVFLSKLSGQEDIVTGTPTAGRTHADLDHIVGMFVNTLALRAYPAGSKKFAGFLEEVKEKTLADFENQGYQFEDLVEKVAVRRDISRNPLFDVMFTVQNVVDVPVADADSTAQESQGLKLEFYPQEHVIAKFDFSLAAVEVGEVLYFTCEFRSKLFKKETILRFVEYFKQLVSSILEDPSRSLSQLTVIPETEKKRLLTDFNETGSPYPGDKTLDELFAIQAARNPDGTAVVYVDAAADQPAANQAITYRQLSDKALGLAQQLQAGGVGPDTLVGLMVNRSIDMIAAMLGILKAGGAYVPIDPEYPQDRIEYMLADSSIKILVTCKTLEQKASEMKKISRIIFIDDRDVSASSSSHLLNFSTSHSANLAYVLYTSGSTGRPKGVPVQQGNVARLVLNSNYIRWQPGNRLLLTGSMAFDITTFEIWGPLLNGLILYLAPQEIILAGKQLQELLEQHRINILHLIPQLFNQLADQHPGIFAGLDYFLVGGDLVRPYYVNRIRNMYSHLNILHMYGPTENTTFSTYLPVKQDYESSIPIGKPIGNTAVYIIDRHHGLVPLGVPGELTVGGDGVARGYLNRPELTAETFISNPFSAVNRVSRPATGGRIYKTGDLARWLPEGIIEFLGRQDSQVKIRGIRIEIEEIESQLTAHPDIKGTVVIFRENETAEKYLCAYFLADKDIPITQLRKYLAEKLPEYMIPAYFIQLEAFPLSANGKVDQKALPQPGASRPVLETEFAAPRSRLETSIANIWKEVLKLEKIGIHDNFFDLGGNSLIIVKVNTKLNRELDREIPLVKMFRYPTIESLARSLREETGEAAFNENIEESVTEMEETMQMLMGEDDE